MSGKQDKEITTINRIMRELDDHQPAAKGRILGYIFQRVKEEEAQMALFEPSAPVVHRANGNGVNHEVDSLSAVTA